MKIALTHNLQRDGSEEEAEFDTPETIAALCQMLESLGHELFRVDVSMGIPRLVEELERIGPDLIFNTAEGRRGRFREALYPAVFDDLGLPYTASDAYVCAVTLDKQLTKLLVARAGVRTPAWKFVDHVEQLADHGLRFPVIVKPNFEGSSKGITVDSIVEDEAGLRSGVRDALATYPSGLLIEEFIVGRDVTVPYIEGTSPATRGVLPAAEYAFDASVTGKRKFQIYDYALKQHHSDAVSVEVPAKLATAEREAIVEMSRRAVQCLGIRDVARLDFRLAADGTPYFIEVNALPSFEPGASIYLSGAAAGFTEPARVLEAVISSALARTGSVSAGATRPARRRSRRRVPRVGLIYNLKRVASTAEGEDSDAEYDSEGTVSALADAISDRGCEVVRLEATPALIDALPAAEIDVAFNIAEGLRGRSREAQVPALLELLGVPYTGSDPVTLALTLDKGVAKRVVAQAGVATPAWESWRKVPRRLPDWLEFPVMVKPVAEGSSKGVVQANVVTNEAELRSMVPAVVAKYGQPALVESFLPGREFTVGLLGGSRPRVLPPLEIVFTDPSVAHPVYSFHHKIEADRAVRFDVPAAVEPKLLAELGAVARASFSALGCRDVARIDLRLDRNGRVNFIECNPLPGLTPGFSDLCLIASAAGMSYEELIGTILGPALRRAGFRTPRLSPRPAKGVGIGNALAT